MRCIFRGQSPIFFFFFFFFHACRAQVNANAAYISGLQGFLNQIQSPRDNPREITPDLRRDAGICVSCRPAVVAIVADSRARILTAIQQRFNDIRYHSLSLMTCLEG